MVWRDGRSGNFLTPIFTMISAMASSILPSSFSTVLGPYMSPIGFLRLERLQLSDDDFDHPVSSNLELVVSLDPAHRLEKDELDRRQCHKTLQGFQGSVLPILRPERRGMVVSQQGVDVRLQVHDLHQFLADNRSGLFSVKPHFVRNAHRNLHRL